ncbi:MAG TPA: cupredoxin domain-containing protein [Nocardioidaceae bacterium]|nr:cupredoxin domain-containing protein [Nocardioidaceae bacterium]
MTTVRQLSGLGLCVSLAFGLVACGADERSGTETGGTAETAPAETQSDSDAPNQATQTVGAADAGQIEVVETSYDIFLADEAGDEEPLTISVPSTGSYTFRVTNDSEIVHALEIEGHGVEAETGDIEPGGTATFEVILEQAGEYDLYCPIGNHKSMGMDGSLIVEG